MPSAPTSLALTKTHNSISATFAAPTDLGNGTISRYDIRIDSGAWIDTGLDLSHTFSSLEAETEYTIDVAGVNSAGRGATATLSATTDAAPLTVPSAPQNLTATAQTNGTSVELGWDAPSDNGGTAITDYEYRVDSGAWTSTGSTSTSYTVTTLSKGTEYDFEVRAVNSEGNSTAASVTETTATTNPGMPTGLTATPQTGGESIRYDWVAPTDDGGTPITDYEYRFAEGSMIPSGTGWVGFGETDLSHLFDTLTPETLYSIRIRARNANGTSSPTPKLEATTLAAAVVALSFGSETIANQAWVVGTAATVTLPEATGGVGTIVYSLSPALPAGKTFTASTRVLAGTPTGRFSSATFTYTATDGDSNEVELTFTIVVTADAITFASNVANQSWQVGTAVNLTLPTASGGVGAFTYTLTPALPAGVTRSNRVVSGTPTTAVTVATYTYTATDAESEQHTQTFTIVVAAASAIVFSSTIAAQAWTVGTAITSLTLPTATGGVGTITYLTFTDFANGYDFHSGNTCFSGDSDRQIHFGNLYVYRDGRRWLDK